MDPAFRGPELIEQHAACSSEQPDSELRHIQLTSLNGDILHSLEVMVSISDEALEARVRLCLCLSDDQDFYLVHNLVRVEQMADGIFVVGDLAECKNDQVLQLSVVKSAKERRKVLAYAKLMRDAAAIWGNALTMGRREFDPCDCKLEGCSTATATVRCPRRGMGSSEIRSARQLEPVAKWAQDLEEEAPRQLPLRKLWFGVGTLAHQLSQVKCKGLTPDGFDQEQHVALLARAARLLQICRDDDAAFRRANA